MDSSALADVAVQETRHEAQLWVDDAMTKMARFVTPDGEEVLRALLLAGFAAGVCSGSDAVIRAMDSV